MTNFFKYSRKDQRWNRIQPILILQQEEFSRDDIDRQQGRYLDSVIVQDERMESLQIPQEREVPLALPVFPPILNPAPIPVTQPRKKRRREESFITQSPEGFQCPGCSKKYKYKKSLISHIKKKHEQISTDQL